MSTQATSRLTAEEFAMSPESEGYELVHGVPEEVSMGGKSSWIGGEIFRRLANFVADHPQAAVFPQDTALDIWPDVRDHFRKPDVMVVPLRGLGGTLPEGLVTTVPWLVVEVVSPHDDAIKLEQKLDDYRRGGVPLVWVIYPETHTAYARHGTQVDLLGATDTLDAGPALPGFTLGLAELFAAADGMGRPTPRVP
ncbi:MAG: Uma2 family endonuclease [Chloroflexi bacterium]|nr:Uma2 family endonuclease [Chloroflexota bacterium]